MIPSAGHEGEFTQPRVNDLNVLLPSILLTPQVELAVEWVIPGNLDGVALGVEVLELHLAALESLPEVPSHLRQSAILRVSREKNSH